MPRTRIRGDQAQDISFVSEEELNQFFSSVVITGTADLSTIQQTFDDYFPGRNLVVAGDGVAVTTGTNFVQLSTTGSGVVAGVDQITASGITLSGSITLEGLGSTSLHPSGQTIVISGSSVGVSTSALTVKESDGSPSVSNVDTIVVTTGTLTDDGGGQVTIDTGGGGGGEDIHHFSFEIIAAGISKEVPFTHQMTVHEELVIESTGELLVEGTVILEI